MKRVIAWLLVLALTATVSIGATLAYLTDTDEDVNVMTLGKVKIDQLEYERIDDETQNEDAKVQEFHDNKPLYPAVIGTGFDYPPGDSYIDWEQIGKDGYTSEIWDPAKINNEVDKMVFVKNKGDYDAYVRSVFAFEAGKYSTLDEFQKMVHLNLNETDYTWEWLTTPVTIGESTYFVATATYNKVLAPGSLTEISLSQIALDKTATNEDVEAFGETYQVLVKSQGIQADGFTDADTALMEGFGDISSANIPWKNDSPVKGIDLRTALHYYEGDRTNQITSKVTNVVFGLNKAHANVVSGYEGTLVDVEQDVPVYAYYVPGNGGYDVYFLADDAVYTPKDSRALFKSMTALQTVDTTNMDVSRTEDMYEMFRECSKLGNMDLSDWNTGNVTNMQSMFRDCDAMTALDLSGWNVEKVESLYTFAYSLDKLTKLDISGWNLAAACDASWAFAGNFILADVNATNTKTAGVTSVKGLFQYNYKMTNPQGANSWTFPNVLNANSMFEYCYLVTDLKTGSWDLSNCQSASGMFNYCTALQSVEGSGSWDLSNCTNISYMFQVCEKLPYLDVTGWGLNNCTTAEQAFMYCRVLETVEGSENWNTGKLQNMSGMFLGDYLLADLDVSTWDTGSVTTMMQAFRDCLELQTLAVSDWDVSNVSDFSGMFTASGHNTGGMKLQSLDVSNWDTSSATTFRVMFYGCSELKTMDLSGWDTTNVTTLHHMFADCFSLVSVDFTGWNTPNLTNMDGIFNDCISLTELDMSMFNTSKVETMAQLFEGCASLKFVTGMDKWDTSSLWEVDEMFNSNSRGSSLEWVDLSSFNTSKLLETYSMFDGCTQLKTVYVGDGWDMSKVTNHGSMFSGCSSLVGGNGSTVAKLGAVDKTYACVDTPETPGYLTHISQKS